MPFFVFLYISIPSLTDFSFIPWHLLYKKGLLNTKTCLFIVLSEALSSERALQLYAQEHSMLMGTGQAPNLMSS